MRLTWQSYIRNRFWKTEIERKSKELYVQGMADSESAIASSEPFREVPPTPFDS